ncbi:BQ2448_6070 [Microbotryum intermedium]|uniref:BQ2448_6070 protein n=1 Tax=Microbotryum intermedium TaxID=269621 RepID=A0A238FIM1_9BASI|nr:BQ2448_6070 [Microbotryum intermedium]
MRLRLAILIRSARLFSGAWRCAPTVVFSPRLDYTLVRYVHLALRLLSFAINRRFDYTLVSLLFYVDNGTFVGRGWSDCSV